MWKHNGSGRENLSSEGFLESKTKERLPTDRSPFSPFLPFHFSRVSSIFARGWRSMTRRDATWRLDAMPDTCWRIVEGVENMVRACEGWRIVPSFCN